MGDKKRRIEFLSFYNFTGIEKHLSKMAQTGWLIESISSLYWTYRKIEPMKLHFSIKYCPAASEYDPKPAESQQALVASCAHRNRSGSRSKYDSRSLQEKLSSWSVFVSDFRNMAAFRHRNKPVERSHHDTQ